MRGMSGKPSPLTASAARAPPGISAADGERGPSFQTGPAGISIRVLIASPRTPRRAAVEAGSGPVRPQSQLTALASPAQAHGLARACIVYDDRGLAGVAGQAARLAAGG